MKIAKQTVAVRKAFEDLYRRRHGGLPASLSNSPEFSRKDFIFPVLRSESNLPAFELTCSLNESLVDLLTKERGGMLQCLGLMREV